MRMRVNTCVLTLGCLGLIGGCASMRTPPAPITIQSVHLTAANHYVDLRYRVLDSAAAQRALGPGVKPRLIDERTGITMAVPTTAKLGSLRQTQNAQKPNHTYFVLFINGAGLKPGSRVTAELGTLRFTHLTVQ
jgi:hypothetical protein